MIRHGRFAPALEHRDNSNKEQEDRADRKNLEQHWNLLIGAYSCSTKVLGLCSDTGHDCHSEAAVAQITTALYSLL
jgi:hypothetical protein